MYYLCVLLIYSLKKYLKYHLAKRIEKDVNLNEQVKTMVEFKDVNSPIVELQRKKTMETLDKVDSKSLKMKFSFKNFTLTILALILVPLSIIVESKEIAKERGENWINLAENLKDSPIYEEEKE